MAKPTTIGGTYTDDYDIIYVNDVVINTLHGQKHDVTTLTTQLGLLKELLKKPQTVNAKKETCHDITVLEQQIQSIVSHERLNHYIAKATRSEEHTSELQSLTNLVCR